MRSPVVAASRRGTPSVAASIKTRFQGEAGLRLSRRSWQIAALAFTGLLHVTACAGAAENNAAPAAAWPQFRGPEGSGVAADGKPPTCFGPDEGVQWKIEVPWSPSSPVLWGDSIFLTTFHEGELETRCHARTSGQLRWARGLKPENVEGFHRTDGSPAASTPATDGHRVVSYFGSFGLVCHDFAGKELWRHPLPCADTVGQYGSGTSPIIVGTFVVLNRDQYRYSSLLALDLETGAKRWETHRPDASSSFGTPAHWRNRDHDEIVVAASGRLKGYDLKSGAERWLVEGVTGTVCTTPIAADGQLYFAAWSNHVAESSIPVWPEFQKQHDKNGDGIVSFDEVPAQRIDYLRGIDADHDGRFTEHDWVIRKAASVRYENVMVAVRPGGSGDISETHVAWKTRRGVPYVPSPLFYDGRVYLVKDGGMMTCLDARSREEQYVQERIGANGNYYASPVAAAGHIYLASLPGKLSVVKAGGSKPEVVHQADFGERIIATPALSGEMILVRTATKLWAFGQP